MATYSTDFSGYTSDAQPSDWTKQWKSGNITWLTRTQSAGEGGKVLEVDSSVTELFHGLKWGAIDSDANRDNAEIFARFRPKDSNVQDYRIGFVLRGSGGDGTHQGYQIWIGENPTPYVRLYKNVAGTNTVINDRNTYFDKWVQNDWYLIRFRVNGTTLSYKVWRERDNEPASWDYTATDSSVSGVGWVGLANYNALGNADVDFVGVGTNGDTAPSGGGTETIRVTQLPVESLTQMAPALRVSQYPVEALSQVTPPLRVSQLAVEVLSSSATEAPPTTTRPQIFVIT